MILFLKHLWKDDDGVALAFGITFFLLAFLLAMSVYAAGETVRRRLELQNAVDAAAYSGTVVQADTLSRVACVNQAMSWTYVMMNRRCMDYVSDKWLEKVEQEWDKNFRSVREEWNWQSTCGTRNEGSDFWTGYGGKHREILLNRSQMVNIDRIKAERKSAAAQGKGYRALAPMIERDRKTLAAMFQAERNLLGEMPLRIDHAVKAAFYANISETPNDGAAGGAEISHVLLQESPFSYTEIMKNNAEQERIFLVFGDFRPDFREISPRGIDKWWIRSPEGQDGFHRKYTQTSMLLAEWQWFGIKYINTGTACVPHPKGVGPNMVRGSDVEDGYFQCGEVAKAYRLTEEFFGRKGSIVVGAKRKLNNPFAFMFHGDVQGLFYAFSVPDKRCMWTVAAARAGYASPFDKTPGLYENTFLRVSEQDTWNLRESDWDASFLPAALAFDRGKDRKFTGNGKVLPEVYGKLAPGSVAAPPGMKGDFQLQNAREALKH